MNHMVHYKSQSLDSAFAALSDATRRGVMLQLGMAEASISDLATRFDMTLTGMKKHVGVLEAAGFVITQKVGRVRKCRLGPRRMQEEAAWIEQYRRLWDARFNALDGLLETITAGETSDDQGK
jgi:DNA-binding transcriptional ArsR family regulator